MPKVDGIAPKVEQSDEAKALMKERGWDKGYVVFGAPPSETTVKVLSAVELLTDKPNGKFKLVEVSFDDAALGKEDKLGVKSDAWALLTGGRSSMPALAIDGEFFVESELIVKKLAIEEGADHDVIDLINLSAKHSKRMLEAATHWGWSGLHKSMGYAMVNEDHYSSYGEGNKSAEWESTTCGIIDTFLHSLEATLSAKKQLNGYFVGNSITYADCSLINWYLTFSAIANIDLESRYPKFCENYQILKSKAPKGAEGHFEYFPGFGDYVANAMGEARANGFDINKAMDKAMSEAVDAMYYSAAPVIPGGSCPLVEYQEHYKGTQYYYGEEVVLPPPPPPHSIEHGSWHYRSICKKFVTVRNDIGYLAPAEKPQKRIPNGQILHVVSRITVYDELGMDREDGGGRHQIYLKLDVGGYINAFSPKDGTLLTLLLEPDDIEMAEEMAHETWVALQAHGAKVMETQFNVCLVYDRTKKLQLDIELHTPAGIVASKTGTKGYGGAVAELGPYKYDCGSDVMMCGEPSYMKNISSMEVLEDGVPDGTPDYRVIVRGPKTITASLKEKIERGKATKEEVQTFEAAQEAKKEQPMEFKLVLFGPAMPGLIPKMYTGTLVGLDAFEGTVDIEIRENGSVQFIPMKKALEFLPSSKEEFRPQLVGEKKSVTLTSGGSATPSRVTSPVSFGSRSRPTSPASPTEAGAEGAASPVSDGEGALHEPSPAFVKAQRASQNRRGSVTL
mmetsp:Transcript_29196/g.78367  ORF Transcript_29196/g.78367 Transcript_29196/m.78367 type:complete len:733 (-) Transcript_29196:79-2277(-)